MERTFQVYFTASKSGVLYLGVTSNLSHRVAQHKEKILPGSTQKYNVTKLVWFEPHTSIRSAIRLPRIAPFPRPEYPLPSQWRTRMRIGAAGNWFIAGIIFA